MAHGIYGTSLRAVWCNVLFTRQHLGISSDSAVVSSTAQIIDIRLRAKALDYSQYTPICQNVPVLPSRRLPSADKVFIVLVPSLYETPDCWVVSHNCVSHSAVGRFDKAVCTVLAHQCSLVH
ncbi:hypothetical protein M514_22768 [Trichuris suis]|uniref:Uncharacterized protein n=1 Tax=Trichuris suis TaxID=68888 RepID=A0A085N6F5_9BILA|nr:hypothetical protein M514_22768 [Trichuris suis]